jgi:hypothetical protein
MRCERWWPMKPLTPRIRTFIFGSLFSHDILSRE